MLKRECQKTGAITKCQVPINEQGVSGITDLLLLIFVVWFVVHMVIRFLGRLVK